VCIDAAQTVDVDQDSLDDSCDSCLRGPPHDEDGDGHDDGCDSCPADPNPADAELPLGQVGAVCTAGGGKRLLFDPFIRRIDAKWSTISAGWTIDHDVATVRDGLRSAAASVTGNFRIATSVRLDASAVPASASLRLESRFGFYQLRDCTVDSAGALTVTTAIPFVAPPTVDVTGPVSLVLRTIPDAAGWTFVCEATDASGVTASASLGPGLANVPWTVSFVGQGTVGFEFADIVTE
jgi:hypothetical protein